MTERAEVRETCELLCVLGLLLGGHLGCAQVPSSLDGVSAVKLQTITTPVSSETTSRTDSDSDVQSLIGLQAVLNAAPSALLDQWQKFPKAWRSNGIGLAERFGSEYGQYVLSESIELEIAAAHHEARRYVRIGYGSAFSRALKAFEQGVVVPHDGGTQTVALGHIAGVYGAWAVGMLAWEPRSERSMSQYWLWSGLDLISSSTENVFREFWPEIRRVVSHHRRP